MIYIRQSTLQQVHRHQESTRLQYGLVDQAIHLGWPRQCIEIVDEDLGCSGASAEGRHGFQRLVAEVGLDHVGMVLGLEMSRLSRSSRDWHQLLEVCAIFGTLIGDLDGIYDPTLYNDRLLLGLKGTMSEAELHILKQRMLEGKRAKARRGELGLPVPMGYVRQPSGEVVKDPDEQAQTVIQRVFELFERKRTINGVLAELVAQQIQMPYRVASGTNKDQQPDDIILFMDGVHPQHNPVMACGWIKRGLEFKIQSNTGRQRLNVNGAVNIDSLETICRFYDTINGEATIDLCKAIEEYYPKAGTIYIICDNARYYRSKEVSRFLETSRIELVFLPPYAPNLNLIERYWRYFKKEVLYDHYYETFKEFKRACENFFSEPEKHAANLRSLLTENFQIIGA